MFLTASLLTDLTGICLAFAVIFVTYYKWSFSYWRRRNFLYLEPSIPFGNLKNNLGGKEAFGITLKKMYDEMRTKKWKHGGIFFLSRPYYFVTDLEYVKNILTKDFQYFPHRGLYYNEKSDPLGAHLVALKGEKWRNLRVKLTPTFTSGKMKMMFQTLIDCESNLQDTITLSYEKKEPIDIKDALACFTTDIIGSCAFGLECNTFETEDSPFRKYGKKVFEETYFRRLMIVFSINFPKLAAAIGVRQVPKDVADFFSGVVKDTVEYREKNDYTRKDFMQMLIDLKNNKMAEEEGYKHDGKTLTIDEIAAQSFVFFLAGFETSSTATTFTLYELAKNQDIQEKLRNEINAVLAKYDGKLTYEGIQEMKYMNQIIDESLRKYPPVPFVPRECVKDYKVPGEDIVIEKGTRVVIPIYGIHHDKEYYPNPEKFDPERFSQENSRSRHPYAHIPFGEGPRNCIGLRFGLMQVKVSLASLLRRYNFTVNKKTKEPLIFSQNSFILSAEDDIWLDVQKL